MTTSQVPVQEDNIPEQESDAGLLEAPVVHDESVLATLIGQDEATEQQQISELPDSQPETVEPVEAVQADDLAKEAHAVAQAAEQPLVRQPNGPHE